MEFIVSSGLAVILEYVRDTAAYDGRWRALPVSTTFLRSQQDHEP